MTLTKDSVVLAAVAHPDDIEFYFAGTLLLLEKAGCRIHMWNLADGCCGSTRHSREEIACLRAKEASSAAQLAGAQIHPSLFHDLEIFYDRPSLASVGAVVRGIRPQIILTHAPDDYMEDHQNVCRLLVTSAFSRAMPNFTTSPDTVPYAEPVRIYHAPPHGLRDGLGNPFRPDFLIDIESVMETKRQMLACHQTQQDWLASSQGMNAYVREMEEMCREMAGLGQGLDRAEVWRRHSHLGFCPPDFDPLLKILQTVAHQPRSQEKYAHAQTHQ